MKSNSIEIIIATTNKYKFLEIKEILSDTLKDTTFIPLGNLQEVEKPEENGKTFLENALIKAKYYFYKFNTPVISEDSGLEVEELNNEPGVLSARYAGPNSSQKDLIDKLLRNMENKTNRNARFVCSAVFMYDKEKYVYSEGIVKGKIAIEPRGTEGFGYDPVFIPEGYDKTFSELGPEIKNKISHRRIALTNLAEKIKKILNQEY